MNKKQSRIEINRGFTLIEIMVVLVIATVVLSIAIPRIRTINDERRARESARVIGSAFSTASQRAAIDGVAGVRITRNTNILDSSTTPPFQVAATQVSLLRAVPNYSGDQLNSQITGVAGDTVMIPTPFEQTTLEIVQEGDSISFSSSSIRYEIESVANAGGNLTLTLDRGTGDYLPMPSFTTGATNPTYVIQRLPRILRSSTVTLPDNYIIDLRFSGFEVTDGGGQLTTVFEPLLGGAINNADIEFIFDDSGSIDRVLYKDGGATTTTRPLGPAYFFITESPESILPTDAVASTDTTSLWVTVSNLTGSTNIGYNNSLPSAGQTYASMAALYSGTPAERAQFNTIINNSRAGTSSSSANQ